MNKNNILKKQNLDILLNVILVLMLVMVVGNLLVPNMNSNGNQNVLVRGINALNSSLAPLNKAFKTSNHGSNWVYYYNPNCGFCKKQDQLLKDHGYYNNGCMQKVDCTKHDCPVNAYPTFVNSDNQHKVGLQSGGELDSMFRGC